MNAPPQAIICLIKSNITRAICWNWSLTFLFANLIKMLNIILIRKNWAGTSHQTADIRIRHARLFLWIVIVHFFTSHGYARHNENVAKYIYRCAIDGKTIHYQTQRIGHLRLATSIDGANYLSASLSWISALEMG